MFLSRHMKNIRIFVSENLQFLEVKVSIYFNRRVFVMPYPGSWEAGVSAILHTL